MASSQRRIDANRRNAQKSTGPKTKAGKEIARANAYTHGMTAVVVLPGEERDEAARRTDRLQKQLAPDGDELGLILAKHVALLSMQVERCARNEEAMALERVRTAEADRLDARRAQAEHLFTYIGAEGPTNHRRLLDMPEGIDLIVEQLEALKQDTSRDGAAWDMSHGSDFDHLTGRRYYTPITRMAALSQLIERDDIGPLDPTEIQGNDRPSRRAWATREVLQLIGAEIDRLRVRRAELIQAQPTATSAADRATVGTDPVALKTRKYQFAAQRAMSRTLLELRHLRRDEKRRADPVAQAHLRARMAEQEPDARALPPVLASFCPDPGNPTQLIDALTTALANNPVSTRPDPSDAPNSTRYTP